MGLLSIFAIVVMVVLLGSFAFKVGPVHWEHHVLSGILEDMEDDANLVGSSALQLKSLLASRININGIYDVSEKHITVRREGNFNIVNLEYKTMKNLYKNADVVLSFKDSAKIKRR